MPTQLIKKYIEEFAQWLRNEEDYNDWDYATEPIPGDRTWCRKSKSGSCKIDVLERSNESN